MVTQKQQSDSWRLFFVLPDGTEKLMDKHELFNWIGRSMMDIMLAGKVYPNPNPDLSHLYAARELLLTRLKKGHAMIEQLREGGGDFTRHEKLWIELLQEYELLEEQIGVVEA